MTQEEYHSTNCT